MDVLLSGTYQVVLCIVISLLLAGINIFHTYHFIDKM